MSTIELLDESTTTLADIAEIRDGRAIVAYSKTEAGLSALESDLRGKTYDLTTTAGDKAARADRLRCVTLRNDVERMRKAHKAPALEFGKMVDAEAARITKRIEAVEAPIDTAIKADEQRRESERQEREAAEAARKAKHEAGIATIRGYVQKAAGLPASRVALGIAALEKMGFGEAWEEYQGRAEAARDEVLAALREMHAGAVAREAEAARLAEQRAEQERIAAAQRAEAQRLAEEAAAAAKLKRQGEAMAAMDAAFDAAIARNGYERAAALRDAFIAAYGKSRAHWIENDCRLADDYVAAMSALQPNQQQKIEAARQRASSREVAAADAAGSTKGTAVTPGPGEPEAAPESLSALRGMAAGLLGNESSEEFVERVRSEGWNTSSGAAPQHASDQPMPEADAAPGGSGWQESAAQQAPEAARPGAGDRPIATPAALPPSLKLGDINARLAPLRIDAAGLAQLGFEHAAADKSAKRYHKADWPRIKAALVKHIEGLR